MKNIFLSMASLLLIAGCGGGSNTRVSGTPTNPSGTPTNPTGLKYPTVDVKYTLNGTKRPTCHNANDIGKLTPTNSDFVECTWVCGRYNGVSSRGSDTVYVALMFRKTAQTDEGIWELSEEYVVEAEPLLCKDI